MVSALEPVRRHAREWARARVRGILAPRRDAAAAVAEALHTVRAEVRATELRLEQAIARLDPTPFRVEMTVHAAHARHPAVAAAFARRGLPACPACAVGADETLAEAAFAEGFDAHGLVAELNALPRVFPPS